MMDKHGNLLTSDEAISNRAVEVYSERLSNNNIQSNFEEFEKDTNTLCELRLNISKKKTTKAWTLEELKLAIKQLHNNRSRDPEGFMNELFKEKVVGDDLLEAVLKLMNMIKEKQ